MTYQTLSKDKITKVSLISVAIVFAMTMLVGLFAPVSAAKPAGCTRIQDGVLENTASELIPLGYMDNGYNYQAHLFNGPWGADDLVMKWNDAWLSNKDCDADKLLDRHLGFATYRGSGAWLTNQFTGTYPDGTHWTWFTKIVAAPIDATLTTDGVWIAADGTEIGPVIWGQFATVMIVSNDSVVGEHGAQYVSPNAPGFGVY